MSAPYDEEDKDEEEEGQDEEGEDGEGKQEIDPESLESGPKTIIVGEWSQMTGINEAIEAAAEKDTIYCNSGEYDEEVKINKLGISILGPPDLSASVLQGITSSATAANVSKLSVKGGISIRCGNLQVSECDIHSAHSGIQILKTANPRIVNCAIHGIEKCNVAVFPGGNGCIEKTQIIGTGERGSVGLYMDDAGSTLFRDNQISNVMTGVYTIHGCKGAIIHGNKISGITGHGIYTDQESKPNIKNNEIADAEHYGIVVAGGSGGVFGNNIVHSSIRIYTGCRPSFFDNIVVKPGTIVNDDSLYALRGVSIKRFEDLPKPKKPKEPEPE
jgi:parallel beta-helix repeat protein|eukprot:CAMPEP_0174286656 /NCGR_PEP_ID=MMETSP0809-20121228/12735_1 /TAXON_ID=73025 ORGANISM="Eutreptiella gymnastica-like, Strain CCMP1594" /NCGR_SAMPLE_ID=MMETSP0809 /ASSEMBLY_ACC=CAM_ASM_000658 /LENGTH=329 /DNA_ID=CAMNT_0015382815 /DNA_START=30 /DNA_END=1019 /DNA_ORIENTATION=+